VVFLAAHRTAESGLHLDLLVLLVRQPTARIKLLESAVGKPHVKFHLATKLTSHVLLIFAVAQVAVRWLKASSVPAKRYDGYNDEENTDDDGYEEGDIGYGDTGCQDFPRPYMLFCVSFCLASVFTGRTVAPSKPMTLRISELAGTTTLVCWLNVSRITSSFLLSCAFSLK